MAAGRLTRHEELTRRLSQLIMVLQDEAEEAGEEAPEPPECAAAEWTEADIRRFFDSKGAVSPAAPDLSTKHGDGGGGGGLEQRRALVARGRGLVAGLGAHGRFLASGDAVAAHNRLSFDPPVKQRYMGGVIIPKDDPLLVGLLNDSSLMHAEKVFQDDKGGFGVAHGFTNGPAAAREHGIDSVYFWDAARERLRGVVAFGEQTSGVRSLHGDATLPTAHGGAVEAVLDDLLASVVRYVCSVSSATAEISVRLRKPCPLYETLRLEAWIDGSIDMGGAMVKTAGSITNAKGEVVASAKCTMYSALMMSKRS